MTKLSNDSERFRSNLLAIVSHELNTPLTAILGAISILEERFPAEREYIPMLRRNSERLQRTVENLMELSRADAGALRVRLSEIDLENFLRARSAVLKEELEKKNFEIAFELEADLPRVCADIKRLAYAFDCLVLNAVKFSENSGKEKAKIFVNLSMESISIIPNEILSKREKNTGMYLVVSVKSSLPSLGESPDHFERLFEPFSPWRDADTRMHEGLGIELALAKEIIQAHDAYIWASFPAAGGAQPWVFHFALPVLSRVDELELVLNNRLHSGMGMIGKLSLLLLRAEPGQVLTEASRNEILLEIQRALFRASDSVFWLEDTGELAVLLDDCDSSAAERVAERILSSVSTRIDIGLLWAAVTGPEDGATAIELLAKARCTWRQSSFQL